MSYIEAHCNICSVNETKLVSIVRKQENRYRMFWPVGLRQLLRLRNMMKAYGAETSCTYSPAYVLCSQVSFH